MRIETREYKVFKFNELSDEVKEKVIDKWYEREDYPFLEEDITQELEQLDDAGIFKDIKLQYSLSWSQGDGLSFSAGVNLDQFIRVISTNKKAKRRIRAVIEYAYRVYSTGNSGRYCYASASDISWDPNYPGVNKDR